ncbi:MAG: FIVAR domain-containing protein [Clostridia bacterium]|nr:FIVAR domain-containing protein [Clostridia bacterium]
MAKTATKRKEHSAATIKRRLSAALVMLLVSSIMLVTSTYAWFTLSTAPEVKGIDTSIAGNGSLEIALMPTNGTFASIGSGRGASGNYAGGAQVATVANSNWGNIVNLSDGTYGLDLITLRPAKLNVAVSSVTEYVLTNVHKDPADDSSETFESYVGADDQPIQHWDASANEGAGAAVFNDDKSLEDAKTTTETTVSNALGGVPFKIPTFGYDGRMAGLKDTSLKTHYTAADFSASAEGFTGENLYGVRAVVDELGDTYGYVIDLAFRLNTVASADSEGTTNGKLLLQVNGAQRVYADGNADATQGGGSNFWVQTPAGEDVTGADQNVATQFLQAVRIAFVKDLGKAGLGEGEEPQILAYARPNPQTGNLYLCDVRGEAVTGEESLTILSSMTKNVAYQISAVVWIDGEAVTNANMAINNNILQYATLNLQFATDVALTPAQNSDLLNNPPAPIVNKASLTAKITEAQALLPEAGSEPAEGAEGYEAYTTFTTAISAAQAVVSNANATQTQVDDAVTALTAAIAAYQ